MKDRLDKKLVEQGLASTRSQALQYIKNKQVYENGSVILKASYQTDGINLEVRGETHYVGRGAHKLLDALEKFKIDPQNKIAADMGASTGGFTQVLLERGASKVFAVDVGKDQLDQRLKENKAVIDMSGVNIRDLSSLPDKIELMVADLSFISLKLVLLAMKNLLGKDADLVVLVKPQFEVGKDGIDKHGIVKNPELAIQSVLGIFQYCQEIGLSLIDAKKCSLQGKTGNQEYLFWLKNGDEINISENQLRELIK